MLQHVLVAISQSVRCISRHATGYDLGLPVQARVVVEMVAGEMVAKVVVKVEAQEVQRYL
jgi:hypothetical protein